MGTYVENTLHINQLIIFENVTTKDSSGNVNEDAMGPKAHEAQNRGVRVSAPLPDNIPFSVGNEVNELLDFLKIKGKAIQFLTAGATRTNLTRGLGERQF